MTASTEEQRERVFEHLRRREQIAAETKAQLAAREDEDTLDPLAGVDEQVRIEAEDAYYAEQGRRRYRTSDGRTLFLTPAQIAQRRRARSQGGGRGRGRKRSAYYGAGTAERKRRLVTWGFNVGAVLLALLIVWVILH